MLPQGLAVQYLKQCGGDPAPVDPNYLMNTPKTLTDGDFRSHLTSRTEHETRAAALFELMAASSSRPTARPAFPLADGAAAHRLLERLLS